MILDTKGTQSRRGFTLIEIVIFLVLLGIFAVFLVQHINTSTQSSVVGFNWLRDTAELQDHMENITAEYRKILTETADDEVTTHADLESLRIYAINYQHVYNAETGYITFDADGNAAWPPVNPPVNTIPSQDPVLLITLQHGNQKVSTLFMSSE